ncbi:MAG: mechanosensitive ion channel family protein [Candidatus ainarchaeum sp.]|nr:mechanosensitive ion channel family protein [Candidatus ainarchaeum sp.]
MLPCKVRRALAALALAALFAVPALAAAEPGQSPSPEAADGAAASLGVFAFAEKYFPGVSQYKPYFDVGFLGNTVGQYLSALLVLAVAWVLLRFFRNVVLGRMKRLAEGTETDLDDLAITAIESFGHPFYAVLSLYVALLFISVPAVVSGIVGYSLLAITIYYVVIASQHVIDYALKKYRERPGEGGKEMDSATLHLMGNLLKGAVLVIAAILLLSNLGFKIDALLAGLGVGGIAIAFALQSALADMFASFSIYFDKPFKVGDYIAIGTDTGIVKKIGIKSTRIETVQGEELVVSNQDLVASRVRNYKRMKRRRIVFGFGVTYETAPAKLHRIPDVVKNVLAKIGNADFERCYFKSFGDFALNFEVIYYVKDNDFLKYVDTQHAINMGITEAFAKEGVEMAYPTQNVFVQKKG